MMIRYDVKVEIESNEGCLNQKEFVAIFCKNENDYGNGFYLKILDDFLDLRYDIEFSEEKCEQYIKRWCKNKWSGNKGSWKVKNIEIELIYN